MALFSEQYIKPITLSASSRNGTEYEYNEQIMCSKQIQIQWLFFFKKLARNIHMASGGALGLKTQGKQQKVAQAGGFYFYAGVRERSDMKLVEQRKATFINIQRMYSIYSFILSESAWSESRRFKLGS